MPITVIGSLNEDITAYTSVIPRAGETVKGGKLQRHLGGKGFNEAMALARLRSPADKKNVAISMLGCVGSDPIGESFVQFLKREGVNTNMVKKIPNVSTGTALITVEPSGQNRILIIGGANDCLKPTEEELTTMFKKSEYVKTLSSNDLPSHLNAHSARPLRGEEIAKTVDISGHQPSNLHAHGSMSQMDRLRNITPDVSRSASGTPVLGLVRSGSSLIHHPSLNADYDSSGPRSMKPPAGGLVVKYDSSETDDEYLPSNLHAHAPFPTRETATYPAPKVDSFVGGMPGSGLEAAARSHLSLAGSNNGGSSSEISARNSYLNMVAKSVLHDPTKPEIDYTKEFVILQNEFPNYNEVIKFINKYDKNITIIYNPSPLKNFDEAQLNSLHLSDFIVVNEVEAQDIVNHYHPTPNNEPLSLLKDSSNYEPNDKEFVKKYVQVLTKLRTMLTKPAIILTMGGNGILYSNSGKFNYGYVPSLDIDDEDLVDTTGCGDTFLGGFTLEYFKTGNLENSIKFGNEAAGKMATKLGAGEAMPTYEEVEKRGWIL